MQNEKIKYGIEGLRAPELNIPLWIDTGGKESSPIRLADLAGNFKVIYCFQSWCAGCHSLGFPSLQKMVTSLKGNDKIRFMAIQTVFEGSEENTYEKIIETQKQYDLAIPFGHDEGNQDTQNISSIMFTYRTGGTPWFIFINEENKVVFNDFHLNTEKAIEFLQKVDS